jgi:4-amino-4-deoxy-L-arabinose transferase-like glycosyltransferase
LALPPLLLVTLFVVTGLRGINFGFHWDESGSSLVAARTMVVNGVFLTRPYVYPGVGKMLVLVPALDDAVRAKWHGADGRQILTAMTAAFDAPGYLLQARSVFVVVCSLGILWVYLAVWALTRRWWQATLAAAIQGLSWELAYHSRWLVNDCLLQQFCALCLLMLVLHHRRGKAGWLWAAAIAAGLAIGTKYTAVLLMGPVMLQAALHTAATLWQRASNVIRVGVIAVASYLVTTPGTLLDPVIFADGIKDILTVYTNGHWGYTVIPGFPHLWMLLRYLAFALFSPYAVIAVGLFAAAIAGGMLCLREDRKLAATLIGFPLLFATFFCWNYSVFIVRNFLLLAPFLAVLSAWGLAEALLRLRWPVARFALAIVIGGALAANAAWLISAGESIRHHDDGAAALEAVAYVRDHPRTRFRVSPKVTSLAAERGLALSANAVAAQADCDQVVFFQRAEGERPTRWIVNDPWLTRAVFGPREVNFNYYSTWEGPDRVVVMTLEKARAAGAWLAR